MENFEDNLFLKANLEKEIPILRTQIQNLYEQLDRKFHLQGAMVPITFGMDTDCLAPTPGAVTMRRSIFIFLCFLSAMR